MIRDIGGRMVSVRTPEEDEKLLRRDLELLSGAEQDALKMLLEDEELMKIACEAEYEREAVDMKTWLEDPYYMGDPAADLFPKLKDDLIELFEGDYFEVILSGSIGYGKTTFADFALARQIYDLSILRNPQRGLGLMDGSPIILAGVSVNEKIAQQVIFKGVVDKILLSPYFRERFKPQVKQDMLVFPKNIQMLAASSANSSVIGMNVVGAAVDETNFMAFTKEQKASHSRWRHPNKASQMYAALSRRVRSRFLKKGRLPGKMMMLSSKTDSSSFTEQKVLSSADDPQVFVREYAIWDVKPGYSEKMFRVMYGEDAQSRVLADNEADPPAVKDGKSRVIQVPIDFKKDFEDDCDGALMELAGVAVDTVSLYIKQRDRIESVFIGGQAKNPRQQIEWDSHAPLNINWEMICDVEVRRRPKDGRTYKRYTPKLNPDATRFIHLDPSLSDDSYGFAMAHVSGSAEAIRRDLDTMKKHKERLPTIEADLVIPIVPPSVGEINYAQIRQLIYELTAHGFSIGLVSMDTYQSADMRQILTEKGYKTTIVSCDQPPDAYQKLRQAIYDGRIKTYQNPVLKKELKQLQWVPDKRKVDHPEGGSKDVSDGLAGVTFTLTSKFSQGGLIVQKGISEYRDPSLDDLNWVLPRNEKGEPMQPKDPPDIWQPMMPIKG